MSSLRRILRRSCDDKYDSDQIYTECTQKIHVTYYVVKKGTKWDACGRINHYVVTKCFIHSLTLIVSPKELPINLTFRGREEFCSYLYHKTKELEDIYG